MLWNGDFSGNNLYQYRYTNCGARDGQYACPYDSQSANYETTNGRHRLLGAG
ncbi:MAG: hypothetical protein HYZ28_04290 [Myxococcales bacterium]|nr:hypothetical protein [Myxococcales bacterium]